MSHPVRRTTEQHLFWLFAMKPVALAVRVTLLLWARK